MTERSCIGDFLFIVLNPVQCTPSTEVVIQTIVEQLIRANHEHLAELVQFFQCLLVRIDFCGIIGRIGRCFIDSCQCRFVGTVSGAFDHQNGITQIA